MRTVLVTGGGRGIGAATAIHLAKQGYQVVVNYHHNTAAAEKVVAEIIQAGGQAVALQADVADEKQVAELFDQAEQLFGPVNYLVNNAGILFTQSKLEDVSVERFQKILNTNVIGCFLCSRELIRRCSGQGAIVNVSSGAARTGSPFEYVDYAASKGAMDTMTKGLSLEVAERGIRVNSVRPGLVYTDMHADGGEPGRVDRLSSKIPLKRGGTSQEVANAIAWLLSDEASYITGTFIDATGGL
ncbi:glucose 1-dehydrogenase [Vibrio sonorensis]|uniref:glucose 1-dehydrogenase n=1 Tax=Vibrio sonorensis TaxID=1004316 RepID=UPI0008DA81C6|nr:glucose 1-dehydrogenase [Vibrio sonorensis]